MNILMIIQKIIPIVFQLYFIIIEMAIKKIAPIITRKRSTMGIKKSKTKIFLTNNRIKAKKFGAIIGIQISIVPIT